MNRSTATSQRVIQHLLDAGVRHIVVAPGSRSAGLAWAAAEAQRAGLCRLHVRLDEREAGFLALGLAKADREPTAVIVTSGTAAANLLPAVVEAHYSALPLVAVTADRPAVVRGHGSPQTIDQVPLLAAYVAAVVDIAVDWEDQGEVAMALAAAVATRRQPVHLNVQFDLPLMPVEPVWQPQVPARQQRTEVRPSAEHVDLPAHGVLLAGDIPTLDDAHEVGRFAATLGWPVLWEPSSNTHDGPTAVSHGPLIAAKLPTPDAVVTVGSVGLSRSVMGLLKATPCHIAVHLATGGPDLPDPMLTASRVLDAVPLASPHIDDTWLPQWQQADAIAHEAVTLALHPEPLSGPSAAVTVWRHAGPDDALVVGASWPVRHLESYAPTRQGLRVFGNRGANGIDGVLSTAYGLAVARGGRTYALVGDVTFLYGSSGLLDLGQPRPDLTVVVLDNDGGGIFSQLEQGRPEYRAHFDLVFGTPHGRDLWVVAEALGVPAARVTTRQELADALVRTDRIPGLHVLVCTTGDRMTEANLLRRVADEIRG